MQTKASVIRPRLLLTTTASLLIWMGAAQPAHSQGTITFNESQRFPIPSYYEQGFEFLVVPTNPPLAQMTAHDGRLYFSPGVYGYHVSVSLTGGGTFGLESVDLWGGSSAGIKVQFNGYLEAGSMVSIVFTVPYDFQTRTYQFGAEFASGLVRVDLPSYPWAMDNMRYMNVVPEPGALSLFSLGVCALVARRRARRPK